MDEILNFIYDIQQSRSRFQIERFVIGQHDTPEMQFYQLCLELQTLITTTKRMELDIAKTEIKIERLRETGDEVDALDAEIAMVGLEQSRAALNASHKEMQILVDIWNSFETKFSREEIESNQEEYWHQRLMRQANAQAIGQGTVDMGHIEALSQAGVLDTFIGMHNEKTLGGDNGIRNLE